MRRRVRSGLCPVDEVMSEQLRVPSGNCLFRRYSSFDQSSALLRPTHMAHMSRCSLLLTCPGVVINLAVNTC